MDDDRPLRISVLLHMDYGEERPESLRNYIREWAETVESSGLDGIYVPTEIGWQRGDSIALLAALSAWTRRLDLGTSVLLAPLYSPLRLAESVATLQQMSEGRLTLGLGMGWRKEEFDASGVDLGDRKGRLLEHLDLLPRLIRGETVSFHGPYNELRDVRIGWGTPEFRTDILVGAGARAGIVRAAHHADGWIAGPFATVADVARQSEIFREAHSRRAGGASQRVAVMREAWVATDDAAAMQEAEPVRRKYAEYTRRVGPMPFGDDWSIGRLAEDRFAFGSPATCAEALSDVVQRTGATELILRAQWRGVDPGRALNTLKVLGQEVAPRVRKLLGQARPSP